MKIFLIGMPGSGKSTLGRELAIVLRIPFVDLDHEIENSEGMTVREIFERKGEAYFRISESNQLKKWTASDKSFVMATGGGTPCFFDNMGVINSAGQSFFLNVPVQEITKRVAQEPLGERPMFANTGLEKINDQVSAVLAARIKMYEQASFTLSGAAISLEEIQKKIRTGSQP